MTEVPPSRYRVVERGRRLEVIDTRGQAPARGGGPDRDLAPAIPRKVRFDGTREWTTHRLYDDSGPRRVRLGPVGVQAIGLGTIAAVVAVLAATVLIGIPVLVALAVAGGAGARHGRPWLTRRLDGLVVAGER